MQYYLISNNDSCFYMLRQENAPTLSYILSYYVHAKVYRCVFQLDYTD